MLTIRMQRRGRSGHAQFRVIVQDSRFHPSSGRVVAYVGNYDPHTKAATLDGEKISNYLTNGAQPSDRVAKLLQKEGIKLPDWFSASAPKSGKVRNADKRRSTRPPETKVEETAAEAATETPAEEATPEAAEVPAEESTTEETAQLPAETKEAPTEPEAAVEEAPPEETKA